MLLPAINPWLVFGLCGYLSETILCESGISAMTVDIYLIPVELGCMEPFEAREKNYLAQLMPDFGHQQVLTVKLRNFSVLPLENELGNMNMEPGKGGKSYWKSSFCTPRNHVWCPPARATTRVVSCAIWLISSAEETWSTWRFFGLRSMAFEAPWRSSSTRISIIITAMYWQTKSSEAVLGLCSLFLDVLDVSWNEWEYLPFWCQLEQDLVHQQHQYSDRWLFVSATSLCWIFTNKLTSQKDCEKRLEFI